MDWMLMPLKRYADFSGRSCRKEYWMYLLGIVIVTFVLAVVEGVAGLSGMVGGVYGPLTTLLLLGTFIPGLAVGIRRLHDLDKSGWMYLIAFIPLVGGIVLIVWFCQRGTEGPNRFGDDPLGAARLGDVFS